MRIGIDISQIVHEGTGVGTYVRRIVEMLLNVDTKNDYVLFGASLRGRHAFEEFRNSRAKLIVVPIPPSLLDFLWNTLHIIPIERFTGPLDIFWSSDWTQPPLSRAKGITTIHDLIALKFPNETDKRIVQTHKRRLHWVKKECQKILCDSEATKNDIIKLLNISDQKLEVIYPGI